VGITTSALLKKQGEGLKESGIEENYRNYNEHTVKEIRGD
jgi:hypothetical protein